MKTRFAPVNGEALFRWKLDATQLGLQAGGLT
jgi:hypothetical protein